MARTASWLLLGALALQPQLSSANAFFKSLRRLRGDDRAERVTQDEVRTSLLAEVMGAFGPGATVGRLGQMEDALRPMVMSLPKNEHGNLGHSQVRYALHRLFVQRHGWFVKGLERAGGAWNDTSPAGILKDRVPEYIQDLFEQRLGERGFDLHELAIFASTLEHLVHDEAKGRIRAAFEIHHLPIVGRVRVSDMAEALETYMKVYIVGGNFSNMTLADVQEYYGPIHEIYPFWNETKIFMDTVQANVLRTVLGTTSGDSEIDFEVVTMIVDKIGEGYGRFQDSECQTLKRDLVNLEYKGSGRVRIADFYKGALEGESWQFSESVDYLRQLGVLDESDPHDPRVIITNYVGSHSNCVVSSNFYSVCCMDECEALLSHVEQHVAGPEATPENVAELVGALSSATVTAPRELPASLLERLHGIAKGHGGRVPLHGRLFSQWLHHAFPRECPYPYVSGTTNPRSQEEWMQELGEEALLAKEEDMRRYAKEPLKASRGAGESEMMREDLDELAEIMWSPEEELLVAQKTAASNSWARCIFRNLAGALLMGVAAHAMVRRVLPALGANTKNKTEKFFV